MSAAREDFTNRIGALKLLRKNPDLNKADALTLRTVDELLDVADEAF
ncbi:hypothetical protein O1M63_26090 [Streptomyces mirabilis]|nr:hypothetical protein [Streptomyces mirabilis]